MKFTIMQIFTTWIYTTLLSAAESSHGDQSIVKGPPEPTENMSFVLNDFIADLLNKAHIANPMGEAHDSTANKEETTAHSALQNHRDSLYSSGKTNYQKMFDLLVALNIIDPSKYDKNVDTIIIELIINLHRNILSRAECYIKNEIATFHLKQDIENPISSSDHKYAAKLAPVINRCVSKYFGRDKLISRDEYETLLGKLKEYIENAPSVLENGCAEALAAALILPTKASYEHHKKAVFVLSELSDHILQSIDFWCGAINDKDSATVDSTLSKYKYWLFYSSNETDNEKVLHLLDILDNHYPCKEDKNLGIIIHILSIKLSSNLTSKIASTVLLDENDTALLAILDPYAHDLQNAIPRGQCVNPLRSSLEKYIKNIFPAFDDGCADILLAALGLIVDNSSADFEIS